MLINHVYRTVELNSLGAAIPQAGRHRGARLGSLHEHPLLGLSVGLLWHLRILDDRKQWLSSAARPSHIAF